MLKLLKAPRKRLTVYFLRLPHNVKKRCHVRSINQEGLYSLNANGPLCNYCFYYHVTLLHENKQKMHCLKELKDILNRKDTKYENFSIKHNTEET